MNQSIKPDRFIPVRKTDVISACLAQENLTQHDKKQFRELFNIIVSTLHFEYHKTLEILKDNYAPFDPNADTLQIASNKLQTNDKHLNECATRFTSAFAQILNAANFEKITEQDLQDALNEESLFKVRLAVEFDDFEEMVFYRRGEYQKKEVITQFWGLRKQTISFTNYDKVAVYIKFKNADYFQQKKRVTQNFEPGSTIIKLFQNVPKADLEMLFPNSEVRMRPLDKAIIGGSALIGGSIVLVTKLGASLLLLSGLIAYWFGFTNKEVTISTNELLALGAGAGVLGGFIFKEWSKFKNRKLKFMKALADNLYFKNLDNNAGVFNHLVDVAEEEECKEAILAYFFLARAKTALSSKQLDQMIEKWFTQTFDFNINFEVDDALNKLLRFGIVEQKGDAFTAVPVEQAKAKMDATWDGIF